MGSGDGLAADAEQHDHGGRRVVGEPWQQGARPAQQGHGVHPDGRGHHVRQQRRAVDQPRRRGHRYEFLRFGLFQTFRFHSEAIFSPLSH